MGRSPWGVVILGQGHFFLGLDPGYGRLGFALIERKARQELLVHRCGVIESSPELSFEKRLVSIEADIMSLITERDIAGAAVEKVFFRKNLTTGVDLLQARGVILLCLGREGIPVREVSPTSLKKMITGHGKADKKQLQAVTASICGLPGIPRPDDAADALALALAAAISMTPAVGGSL